MAAVVADQDPQAKKYLDGRGYETRMAEVDIRSRANKVRSGESKGEHRERKR